MSPSSVAVVVAVLLASAAIAIAVVLVRRRGRPPLSTAIIPDGVLRAAGSSGMTIRDALIATLVPLDLDYRPLGAAEVATLRTIQVTGPEMDAVLAVARLVRIPALPQKKQRRVMEIILPEGKSLTPAKGLEDTFRAFSRNGRGIDEHALLKHVPRNDLKSALPYLAAAAAIATAGIVAYKVHESNERRKNDIQDRIEREYRQRITEQRAIDEQLSRAVSTLLDGRKPDLAVTAGAATEFQRARQFLDQHQGVIEQVVDDDGKVDRRRLERTFGGVPDAAEYFARDLLLSRDAIALYRKSILTEAAAAALEDPTNSHSALRAHLEAQVRAARAAEALADDLTEALRHAELKGTWLEGEESVAARQRRLREFLTPQGAPEARYLLTPEGDVLRVLPPEDDDDGALAAART